MNFLSTFFPQTVYKTSSKHSGTIEVIDHVFERRLVVGGLTQSGGITKRMWEKVFDQQAVREKNEVNSILVLGVGAGTLVEVINKKWPDAKIVGVEIDPVIIDTGKKYFALKNAKNLNIVINDAIHFIENAKHSMQNARYDLIIVDLYKGFIIEKNLQNEYFLQKIAQKLQKNGFVIFNVITGQNANFEAKIFLDKLQRIFKDYFCKRIITNTFFFCANPTPKGGDLSMAKKRKKKR